GAVALRFVHGVKCEVDTATLSHWQQTYRRAEQKSNCCEHQGSSFAQEINIRREFVAGDAAENIADWAVVVEEEQILPGAAGEQIDGEIVEDGGVDAVGRQEIVAVEARAAEGVVHAADQHISADDIGGALAIASA